jgi:hypothetical protein
VRYDSRVSDENINSTILTVGATRKVRERSPIANVARFTPRAHPGTLEPRHQAVAPILFVACDNQSRARACERISYGKADSAGGPGQKNDFTLESEIAI